ncbi:hypothetical protein MAMC_02044 [Methylacidimicrobium cyclopophantes]|uniref:Uncharacterized protein n=1 Tax=Methylacidimicrobium cyclopophantes TaxID=1041766 RepID=A0A5E6MR70_9BACT|nr:hypothetical protein [Methylacidimicrobium cyclopophantes]VVM08306.1 hypothetical protein MAMC_02044 [Methylacidimicrobium cyclopophantes]
MRQKIGHYIIDISLALLVAIAIDRFAPDPIHSWLRNGWNMTGDAMEAVVHWIGRLFHAR